MTISLKADPSGNFGSILINGTEAIRVNPNGIPASSIGFTPSGNIAANNVQAALQEVDTETQAGLATKVSKSGDTMNGNLFNTNNFITLNGASTFNQIGNFATSAVGLYAGAVANPQSIQGGFGMYSESGVPRFSFWGNGSTPWTVGSGMALVSNRFFIGDHYSAVGAEGSKLQISTNDAWGLGTYRPVVGPAGQVQFLNPNGQVGTIITDNLATSYNTSSDYRLKLNPQPLTGSGEFIDALQPKTWEWITDNSRGVGFIAHEVQEVSPSSVRGVKDEVDEDGNPKMQNMEYGSAEFMANIVAELQSLRRRVAELEAAR